MDWNFQLVEQIDRHWTRRLRPRLGGLSDEEYFWEPVPSWSIRPRGSAVSTAPVGVGAFIRDDADEEPEPVPFTTIAWRLSHMTVEVLAVRSYGQFGRDPASREKWDYARSAEEGLIQLDREYQVWLAGVRGLGEEGLTRRCGSTENDWADEPVARLILHIHRELIHHGAEICCLRDLYAHTQREARRLSPAKHRL
jgi:hypothetical protein